MSLVISTISSAIVRRGHPIVRMAALAAATYTPGEWVYYSATGTCTIVDSDTPACLLTKPCLLDHEPRVIATTKARIDIDNQIETSKAPVIWGGWAGPLLVAAMCQDPTGALLKGSRFMIASTTAGNIVVQDSAIDPTGGTHSIYLYTDGANGDLVGEFLWW